MANTFTYAPGMTPGQKSLVDWMNRRGFRTQREAAGTLGIHYMVLNQYLQVGTRRRIPTLEKCLLLQDKAGVPVGSWTLTKVSARKRRKTASPASANKQAAYSHAR